MHTAIETLIRQFTIWGEIQNFELEPIGDDNFTNQNFKAKVNGQIYKIRISEGNQALIGINRTQELKILEAIAPFCISPKVIAVIPPMGHVVMEFIEGHHFSAQEIQNPQIIDSIVQLIKRVHGFPLIEGSLPPFARTRSLVHTAQKYHGKFPPDFEQLWSHFASIEQVLAKPRRPPTLCHNDLASSNIITNSNRIYLLDWEYAGIADPLFDLASFSIHQNQTPDQEKLVLTSYFGAFDEEIWAELQLWKMVLTFSEAIWGVVQASISQIPKDFQGFADEQWQGFRLQISDIYYSQWLNHFGKA